MTKEIGKGICKCKETLIDILFMQIKEIRRKGRWNIIGLHERNIEEIEENRGLNNKKAYEDQFTTFVG